MNSKTLTALTTRRNAYHKPMIASIKKAYRDFVSVASLKPNDEYYFARLYQYHKGERRDSTRGVR